MGEAALAVIGENQGVVFGEQARNLSRCLLRTSSAGCDSKSQRSICCWRATTRSLTVVSSDSSNWKCGVMPCSRARRSSVRRVRVADDAERGGAAADAGDVDRDVGRAAEALFGAADAHNGNRRFGGDAFGVAKPVAVQHGIARHENAGFGKSLFVHKTCGRRNGRHGGRRALIVMVGGPSRRRGRAFANGCNRVLGGSHRLATII